MIILICGGRDFYDRRAAFAALDRLAFIYGPFTVIEGGQRTPDPTCKEMIIGGADFWANSWADFRNMPCRTYKADWDRHGSAAGPIRNKEMLDKENPDIVGFFPGGRGTANMVSQARHRGIKVVELIPRS